MAEEFMIRAFEQTDRQAVIDANFPPLWRAAQFSRREPGFLSVRRTIEGQRWPLFT